MNLAQFMENSARKYPDKIAVRFEGQEATFRELDAKCNCLANGLRHIGLRTGDRCMVMMPNSIKSILVYYAIGKLGAVVVPVNFIYRVHELEHIVTDAEPKAFIGAEPYLEQITEVLEKIGEGPSIRLALGAAQGSGFQNLEEAFSTKNEFSAYPADNNDTFNILYTSGTTGVSKGVMLTHWNLGQNARVLGGMRGVIEPDTLVIGVLPLYHVYGITSVMNVSMYLGLTIELFSSFDPEKVIRLIELEEHTILFAVPTMLNRIIQVVSETPPKRASLKFCVSGGASLPVEFLKRFETLFRTKIHEGYGLTECPVCVENPYGRPTKPGSIGLPIPEFSAKVVDEQGNDVPIGEVGELLIKGPGVMKGYLNRPEDTREVMVDGWLHTGDLARMDEEQYIYIVDRKKELIIRGGYNVYPREIEEVLYEIPEVLEAAVYGVPHEDLGEEVAAVIVLKAGVQIGVEYIQQYCKERVAPYKYPRLIRIVQGVLPKSGSGKILKKEVKKKYGIFHK